MFFRFQAGHVSRNWEQSSSLVTPGLLGTNTSGVSDRRVNQPQGSRGPSGQAYSGSTQHTGPDCKSHSFITQSSFLEIKPWLGIWINIYIYIYIYIYIERERERQRDRDRQRQRERQRETERFCKE